MAVSERLRALLAHPDFGEGEYWQRVRYECGQKVFKEGDSGDDVYIILQGKVRVSASVDIDEGRHIQPGFGDLGEGEVFGELALFDQQPRSATVMVVGDEVELAVVNGRSLLEFWDEHPELGYPVLRELVDAMVVRLRKANQRVFSLFAWGLKARGLDTHL